MVVSPQTALLPDSVSIPEPPFPARKRGKRMSRRKGQNPEVRIGKRANGEKYFYFQYWIDVPGQEDRQRMTHVIGSVKRMTKSEAQRKKLEFIQSLKMNSDVYRVPSAKVFADAVKYYRDVFCTATLRTEHLGPRKVV
jgi:hypothetical protein